MVDDATDDGSCNRGDGPNCAEFDGTTLVCIIAGKERLELESIAALLLVAAASTGVSIMANRNVRDTYLFLKWSMMPLITGAAIEAIVLIVPSLMAPLWSVMSAVLGATDEEEEVASRRAY